MKKSGNELSFEIEPASTQIVDGQHRVAGIGAAILVDPRVADLELCVAIYENLNTQECADIFLSINTEQKPVDRSLVFDLYGIASETIVDAAAFRARDIAMFLNESEDSPYQNQIKLPGAKQRRGGIALSTVVSAIKPLVEEKGSLEQLGITSLEAQKQIILNLFTVLCNKYGDVWYDKQNVFQYAAGFVGAIEFLKTKLIPYCNIKRSFETETISKVINLGKENFMFQSEVKGMAGGEASKKVLEWLVNVFVPETASDTLKY